MLDKVCMMKVKRARLVRLIARWRREEAPLERGKRALYITECIGWIAAHMYVLGVRGIECAVRTKREQCV